MRAGRLTRRRRRRTGSPSWARQPSRNTLGGMEHAETPHELEELEERAPEPPARVAPVVVPRWIQLVVLPLSLVGLWALVRAAGPVVLLFTIAGLLALLLNPFVRLVQRSGLPRGLSVALVYLALVLV